MHIENDENVVDVLYQDDDVHVIKGEINFFEKSQLAYGDLSHASLYCGVFNQKIVAVEKVKKGFISPTVYGFHLLHINHSNVIKVLHSAEQDSSFRYNYYNNNYMYSCSDNFFVKYFYLST